MDKRRQWIVLALIVLAIPAFLFGWNAVHWNVILLPQYAENGVKADAKVVAIVEDSGARMRNKTVTVEHRPQGAPLPYRNWLRSDYIDRLTHDGTRGRTALGELAPEHHSLAPLVVGDRIKVIYLPGEANGRAVLERDFEREYQAAIDRWDYAVSFLGIVFLLWTALRITGRSKA